MGTRCIVSAIACAWMLGQTLPASAALIYDPFDYAAGQRLKDQTNPNVDPPQTWAYVGTGAPVGTLDPTIGDGSLAYPDFAPSSGNSVLTDRTQSGSSRINLPSPTPIASGRVYYSMLVRVNDMAGLTNTTTGSFFAGLNSGTGGGQSITTSGAALLIHRDAENANAYNLGVGVSVNNADRMFDTTELTAGQTLLVVAAYTFNDGADNDVAELWINPGAETLGAGTAPAATIVSDAALSTAFVSDAAQIASFFLRNNSVEPQTIQIDELRVDTTWAGVTVVPEPAGMVIVLGAFILLRRQCRRLL